MAGLLLCIIAIIIGFSYMGQPEAGNFNLLLTIYATILFAVVCGLTGLLSSLRLKNGLKNQENRHRVIENYVLFKKISWLMVLGLYASCIHLFDFPHIINSKNYLGLSDIPLIDSILILSPFFIYAIANLAGLYIGDKILRGSSWSLFAYEVFFLRQFLIPVLPFLVFTTIFDLLAYVPSVEEKVYVYRWLLTIGYGFFIFILFTLAPLLFKVLWKVERLPRGSLRDKVEKMAALNKVKYRDILIWKTGGSNIANAMVTGLFGGLRYIFVTDALVAILPEDEVVAVLAHELGHAKHKHMQIYLLLAVSFIAFISVVEQQLPGIIMFMVQTFHMNVGIVYIIYAFGTLILFWGIIFGFSSRRFEQEADMFAAKQVSPQVFGSALHRIGILSGGSRTMSSWRHFSIDDRVGFMEKVALGEDTTTFKKNMKAAFMVVGIVMLLGVSSFTYEIFASFKPKTNYERVFFYNYFNENYEKSIETANNAIKDFPQWADAYYNKAGALDELDRLDEAVENLEKAIELDKRDIFYYQLAEIQIKIKDFDKAMEMLLIAAKLAPENKHYASRLQYVRKNLKAERLKNGQIPGNGDKTAE